MTTATEVQTLLRFLTQDAKLPLSLAMGKIAEMQRASLTRLLNPSLIFQKPLFIRYILITSLVHLCLQEPT